MSSSGMKLGDNDTDDMEAAAACSPAGQRAIARLHHCSQG